MKRQTLFARGILSAALMSAVGASDAVHAQDLGSTMLEVKNPVDVSRPEIVLELPLKEVVARSHISNPAILRIEEISTHRDLPVQIYSSDADASPDLLLVLVSVGAKETLKLRVHASDTPAAGKSLVFGRPVPERMDDFAWENDKVAHRVYGPALQATGEISSGIDVWSKRVPDLVINDWYARDAVGIRTNNPALSYHHDSGQGMDGYKVGPSRGCGGTGVMLGGKIVSSLNYSAVRILTAGPIRFSFELKYAPWKAGDLIVTESKRITLDAGTHLNKIDATMSWSGGTSLDFATGLALHEGSVVSSAQKDSILAVWEPTSEAKAGMIGTGIVWTNGRAATRADVGGNTLLVTKAHSGETISYYSGAGWSEADTPDQASWVKYLEAFLVEQKHPLETHWQ